MEQWEIAGPMWNQPVCTWGIVFSYLVNCLSSLKSYFPPTQYKYITSFALFSELEMGILNWYLEFGLSFCLLCRKERIHVSSQHKSVETGMLLTHCGLQWPCISIIKWSTILHSVDQWGYCCIESAWSVNTWSRSSNVCVFPVLTVLSVPWCRLNLEFSLFASFRVSLNSVRFCFYCSCFSE